MLHLPIRQLATVVAAVVVASACGRTSSATLAPAVPSPFFALRIAFTDPATGREAAQYGDTTVYLSPDVLMSDDDVLGMRPYAGPDGELVLRVLYHPAARQRLATTTSAHIGDRLAVLLDSRVRSLARIQSQIGRGGDSLAIATNATGADAERLTAQIRSKWRPR
jgi:preprotein translocase subunit SecD